VYNHHVVPRTSLEPSKVPGSSTHQRILRVAKTLFANRGYEHTSTSAISRQAGTSESQLMKHFGSKAGLLEAIFIEGWSEITEEARVAIEPLNTPMDRLQAITRCVLEHLEHDPELKLLLLLEGRRIRKEGQMVALTEGFMSFVKLVDGVLQELADAQMLRPNLNPQAIRSALMGMLEGMLRDRFLADRLGFPAHFDLSQLQEILALALGSFLQGPQMNANQRE
jgi:AcrR family transcriptional regulator